MTDQITNDIFQPGTSTPQLLETVVVSTPIPPTELTRRQIVQTWATRRQALRDAKAALDAATPAITTATQQVNAATTTATIITAVKAYVSANNAALTALRNGDAAVIGALGIIEEAMAWLDSQLADLQAP